MDTSRRTFLAAAGAAAGAVALAACGTGTRKADGVIAPDRARRPAPPAAPPASGSDGAPASFVRHGPAEAPAVAFTFHGSGDLGLLRGLLDAAGRARSPLTIFAVGSWLDQNPQVVGEIQAGGHELANHTYTHPALLRADRARVADEITRGRDALTRHAGGPGRWFRPSGVDGEPSEVILEEAGKAGYPTVVGFDVDPVDYRDPPADAIVARVTAGLHPGAIVSLHTGHAHTVSAYERCVAAARAKHLEPVLVTDLLAIR